MKRSRATLIATALAALLLALPAGATTHRSHAAKAEFQREYPCPATGSTHGACKGYVVDHVQPLCAGGGASGGAAWPMRRPRTAPSAGSAVGDTKPLLSTRRESAVLTNT